jgi:predicted ester cyclase
MKAEHVALARGIYDVIQAGDYRRLPELFTEDYVENEPLPGSVKTGQDALVEAIGAYRAAFSDLRFEIQRVISDGDIAAVHYRFTATHTGDFMGLPPTGRRVDVQGVDIGRVAPDGRCCEHWGYMQEGILMTQLSIPAQGSVDLTSGQPVRA